MTPTPSRPPGRDFRVALIWQWIFLAILLPVMAYLSADFGVTWDEEVQQAYGEAVLRYFTSGFADRTAFTLSNLYLYGGLFDVICVLALKVIPGDPYVVRHLVNSVFGWIGVLFCGRLATRMFGPWSGLIAMILLALSPMYFGHAMNNPKDIPFLALSTASLYYMSTLSRRAPYLSWTQAAKLCVAIALTINIRAGGLLYTVYAGAYLAILWAADPDRPAGALPRIFVRFAALAIAAVLLGTAFWPWAQAAPFTRPFEALEQLTNFGGDIRVLYRGTFWPSTDLPAEYPFFYFLITTPPVVLAGALLALAAIPIRPALATRVGLLSFLFLFPLAYVAVRGSTLYDGVRQLLFAYPPLVVLAAGGCYTALTLPRRSLMRAMVAAVFAAGIIEPLVFQIRNHPYQAVYHNALVGGPKGAFGQFDLEYWGTSLLSAVRWTAEHAQATSRPVRISGTPPHIVRADAQRFPATTFVDPWNDPEFFIELMRDSPSGLARRLAQPGIVYRVESADGAPLAIVTARSPARGRER